MNKDLSTEQRLINILEGTRAGTWEWNVQSGETVFNERWAEIIGYTLEELSPVSVETWVKFVHPEDIENSNRLLQRHFNRETDYYECEARMRHRNGHWVWVLDRGKVSSWTDDGKPLWMFGTHIDITDRKQMRQELKESEERFKALSDASFGGVFIHDNGLIMDCNQGLAEMTGFSREELIGMDGFKLIDPESLDTVLQNAHNDYAERYEVKGVRKDGTVYPLSIKGKNVLYKGKEARVIEYFDLTESKKAKRRLEDIATNIGDWIWEIDADGKYIYASGKVEKILGYKPEEIIGKTPFELMPPEQAKAATSFFNKMVENKQSFSDYENWNFHKDGHLICLSTSGTPTFDDSRNLTGYRGVDKDITDQKEALAILQRSEARFKSMADLLPEGIYETDLDLRITYANRKAFELFGYDEKDIEDGLYVKDLISPEDATVAVRRIGEIFSGKATKSQEYHCVKKNGAVFPVLLHSDVILADGRPAGLRGVIVDLTARIQEEEELLKLRKLESVGVLAGGVAHNFNNTLAAIVGSLEMAKRKINQTEKVRQYLETATQASMRSRDLVAQILKFSRQEEQAATSFDLSLVVEEALRLVKSTLPTTARLNFSAAKNLYIHGNPSQIQECMLNLSNNAVHAMAEKGELSILLEAVELAQGEIPIYSRQTCHPGSYARLVVRDTGCGMDIATQEKIFDPFFTTKGVGEGTGMGLATVQGIMNQHRGLIKVSSTLNEGTSFELYFPMHDTVTRTVESKTQADLPTGTEHILFVDDDEALMQLGKEILSDLGYQVTAFLNSLEGLDHFAMNPSAYDLLITDQTMPGLTGKELIAEVKIIRPEMRTILLTGYSSKIDKAEAKELGIDAFCMKPLALPELSQTTREVLDRDR